MAKITIKAEMRTEFGKGAARRVRRADKVPAVLYEHGTDPLHLSLPGHELMLALKNSNALLSIELPDESHLAIPKQVQRDILKGFIEHVDLLIVKKGEKVTVDIPLTIVGEAAPDTLVVTEGTTISLEVEATNIPNEVEVSIAGLTPGSQVLASDLTLPEGAALAVDDDLMLINITNAPTAADLEADLDTEAAEGDVDAAPVAAAGDAAAEGDAPESE